MTLSAGLTYPCTDGHEHVTDDFGVVHHDCLHGPVQHANLQGSLFLLVLQGVLPMVTMVTIKAALWSFGLKTSEPTTLKKTC